MDDNGGERFSNEAARLWVLRVFMKWAISRRWRQGLTSCRYRGGESSRSSPAVDPSIVADIPGLGVRVTELNLYAQLLIISGRSHIIDESKLEKQAGINSKAALNAVCNHYHSSIIQIMISVLGERI